MAKTTGKKAAPVFASLNPGDMIQGGLPSDFRGKITEAAYVKWDYEGAIDDPVLAVRLTIAGEEMEEPVTQHWSAGDLSAWAPGDEDGDVADEGPCAVRVGKRAQMSNNSNFAHLMQSILDSGSAAKGKPFTEKNLTSSIECLVGLDAQWDRVPQKKRKGLVDADEGEEGEDKPRQQRKNNDILVVTEVFGYDPDGENEAPAKKKVKAKPVEDEDEGEAAGEEEEEVSPLDAKLDAAIVKALTKAGGALKKGKLSSLVLAAFAADKKTAAKAVPRSTDDEFLSGAARSWDFDEDTGVLTLKEDE